MSLKASKGEQKFKKADAIPADNYMARVVQVIDLGVQPQRAYKGEEKPPVHQISVTYELVTEFLKDDEGNDMEDKPRWLSETFPLYPMSSELAKSSKRARVLDPKNEHEGDWSQFLGAPCLVQVVEYEKKDGTIGNAVGSLAPPLKGVTVPELVNPSKFFDLDEPDMEMFNDMPDWLKTKLTEERLDHAGSKLEALLEGAPVEPETKIQEDDIPV